jgi:uncharacterized membrane protein YidH (DUF202 family)
MTPPPSDDGQLPVPTSASAGRPRVLRWFPEAAGAATALVATRWVAGFAWSRGFPLDDAWIHMVYGLALRQTGSFEYNTGTPGAGATSPLWAIVAGLVHAVVGASGPSMGAALGLKVAGAICHASAAALAGNLGRAVAPSRRLEFPSALGAALAVGACPVLAYAAASGMEVSLTSALLLAAFVAAYRERLVAVGALVGLAACARPETALVAPFVFLIALRTDAEEKARPLALALGVAALAPGAWVLRNLVATGSALPATVTAKAFGLHADGGDLQSIGLAFLMLTKSRPMNRGVVWVLVAITVGIGSHAAVRWIRTKGRERRKEDEAAMLAGAAALGALVYVVAIALYTRFYEPGAFYFQRYLLPVVSLFLVAAVGALTRAATMAQSEPRARLAGWIMLGTVVAAASWESLAWGARRVRYENDVATIDGVQVVVGEFLASHLPAGAVVWSPDAGATRYFGQVRVLDMVKLNTPELLQTVDVPESWAPDAIVLIVPYGYRARSGGLFLPTVLETPDGWNKTSVMPQQTVVACPSGMPIEVDRGGQLVARGRCRSIAEPGSRPG